MGTEALKDAAAQVFHTGSFWFTAGPMAAAVACLQELKRIDAPKSYADKGKKLLDGMVEIARTTGDISRSAATGDAVSADHR